MFIVNETRRRLEAGELALGIGMRQARTADFPQIAKTCGFDWLFIDMEHSSYDVDDAALFCAAGLGVGIAPIVRVPGFEHYHSSRVLDSGAQGIVAPHISRPEEAKRIVSACRFPPIGKRSMTGTQPQARFATMSMPDIVAGANKETLVVCMIETPEGLANVDRIAATPGVDVLLIGASDMSTELGIAGQIGHAKIEDAVGRIVAACKAHKKHAGLGGVYDPALMEKYIGMGMRFILSGSDISFLMAGARARSEMLRKIKLR